MGKMISSGEIGIIARIPEGIMRGRSVENLMTLSSWMNFIRPPRSDLILTLVHPQQSMKTRQVCRDFL